MAGCCNYTSKIINLSQEYVACPAVTLDDIRNTALHEIAHALTPGHHHDDVWRQKALEIGCDGKRCHSFNFSQGAFLIQCPCKKNNFTRHRAEQKYWSTRSCKFCKSKLAVYRLANT